MDLRTSVLPRGTVTAYRHVESALVYELRLSGPYCHGFCCLLERKTKSTHKKQYKFGDGKSEIIHSGQILGYR